MNLFGVMTKTIFFMLMMMKLRTESFMASYERVIKLVSYVAALPKNPVTCPKISLCGG